MKQLLKAKTSLTAKVAKTVKVLFFTEPVRYINNDGTVAENIHTYKEFKQDIIKSSGFGW